jgi:molybdate transport system regulatory protein
MVERGPPMLWVKIVLPGRGQVGPGKIALLRTMRDTGSISAAARALELSYKKAWQLVDEMNGMFKSPVVETRMGGSEHGGAQLTALGERLIEIYEQASETANGASAHLLDELRRA